MGTFKGNGVHLYGGDGEDLLIGGVDDDFIDGRGGDDQLFGGSAALIPILTNMMWSDCWG